MPKKINCVLLIDDDKICNYLHEKAIQRMKMCCEVKVAGNGSEALKSIDKYIRDHHEPPELILLDLKMPVMDGFEFLKKVREKYPAVSNQSIITIVTTSDHPHDFQKISAMGNVELFTKPLTEEKLRYLYRKHFVKDKDAMEDITVKKV